MKIFISHSSEDSELAKIFTDLLEKAFHIDSTEIYCTSTHNNINIGDNFINNIRDSLQDAEAVFFLVSENYINSYFCLMEMGASWAFKDNIIPVLVPPLNHNFLKDTPLISTETGMFNNEDDIHNIYEKLIEKNVIERLNFKKESELRDNMEKFIKQANKCIYGSYREVLDAANCLTVTQNGDPEALKIDKKNENGMEIISLGCDFRPNEFYPKPSSFVSYVLQFYPHKNFTYSANNGSLCFEIRSEDGDISDMVVEIRSGNRLAKVYEKLFTISKQWEKGVIPLSSDTIRTKHLKEVAEICFVVKPNFTRECLGTLDIGNFRLEVNID